MQLSALNRMILLVPVCFLLAGCAVEQWRLSTISHNPEFKIRKPDELFGRQNSITAPKNEIIYLEPMANLVDYAYDARRHALEITLEVNRGHTVTVAGPRAGAGQQIRLLNFKQLSRLIRLNDSTGRPRIGASVVIPSGKSMADEHTFTLLLGIDLDRSLVSPPEQSPNPELAATLQSLVIYDYGRDLILAQWTRQSEPAPRSAAEPSSVDDRDR
jgi:hypothetical protein